MALNYPKLADIALSDLLCKIINLISTWWQLMFLGIIDQLGQARHFWIMTKNYSKICKISLVCPPSPKLHDILALLHNLQLPRDWYNHIKDNNILHTLKKIETAAQSIKFFHWPIIWKDFRTNQSDSGF